MEEPADDLLALATSLDGEFTIDRPAFAGLLAVRGRRYDAHVGSWLDLRCSLGVALPSVVDSIDLPRAS